MKHEKAWGFASVALVAVVGIACATPQPPKSIIAPERQVIARQLEFRPEQYDAGKLAGSATLTGQAFLRQKGGAVVTAAGSTVFLSPATGYALEHVLLNAQDETDPTKMSEPPDPRFLGALRTTVADASGRFQFTGLAAGKWIVWTRVIWEVPNFRTSIPSIQGGTLHKVVEVGGGAPVDVILTH